MRRPCATSPPPGTAPTTPASTSPTGPPRTPRPTPSSRRCRRGPRSPISTTAAVPTVPRERLDAAADRAIALSVRFPAADLWPAAIRNKLLDVLVRLERWADALEQLRLIGPYATSFPWERFSDDPLGRFLEIRDEVRRNGRPPAIHGVGTSDVYAPATLGFRVVTTAPSALPAELGAVPGPRAAAEHLRGALPRLMRDLLRLPRTNRAASASWPSATAGRWRPAPRACRTRRPCPTRRRGRLRRRPGHGVLRCRLRRGRRHDPGAAPTARFEVLATGTTRFRLLSVDATGPYLMGEIEELEEEEGEEAGALAAGVLRAFRSTRSGWPAPTSAPWPAGRNCPTTRRCSPTWWPPRRARHPGQAAAAPGPGHGDPARVRS